MDEAALEDLLSLTPGPDGSFVGHCLAGATGRIFGGQVAAQALRAAALTTRAGRDVHSLHSCFLRPGDPSVPVTYVVTVLKDGRSLSTHRVDATQLGRTILTALTSFHIQEGERHFQDPAPAAPDPSDCPVNDQVPPRSNPEVRAPIEFRHADAASTIEPAAPARQLTWLRSRTALGADFSLHAAAMVYATDLTLTKTAHRPLRSPGVRSVGASLDHTLWFHRRFRADDWLLFAQETTRYAGARALSHGRLFTPGGVLVASAAQEALIRLQPGD